MVRLRPDPEAIYSRLPTALQNCVVSLHGRGIQRRRFGREFEGLLEGVLQRAALSGAELESFQGRRLREHFAAATSSPFWSRRFAECGLVPSAEDPFAELEKLPILTKDEVRAHTDAILIPSAGELVDAHTSGSTGAGLRFKSTADCERETWAVWWRYRLAHGIEREEPCGVFGGRSIVPLHQTRPPYHRHNRPGRQFLFSAYHLSERTAADYAQAISQAGLRWLHGYPSMLALLATFLRDQGITLARPMRWITAGAENLFPHQARILEEVFGCPVLEHYGQAEAVANASECAHGRLHVDEDFSLVELVPHDEDDGVVRLVGTNWSNAAFPLFRYDSGDHATLAGGPCPCGNPWRPLEDIDGRSEDYVVRADGSRIGRMDHCFKDLVHIREAQIHQARPGALTLRVVKGEGYDAAGAEAEMLREVRRRVGRDMGIEVEYLGEIPKSARGKLRFVVSELGPDGRVTAPATP